MKLARTEKQLENHMLDEFLSFAPAFIKKLGKGIRRRLTQSERDSFVSAYNFLDREINNRSEKGRKKKVKENARNAVIAKLTANEISVEDASEVLGISKATLYRYWNKNTNIEAAVASVMEKNANAERGFLIFLRLGEEITKSEITEDELKFLKRGLEIIQQHRELAKTRANNLQEGREILGDTKKLTDKQREEMREKRKAGVLIKTLMKEYNLVKSSVYRYLEE